MPQFADAGRAWLVVAIASTFAGNLTIVGSVANLIGVEQARAARIDLSFADYARVGVPLTIVTLIAGGLILSVLPPP